MHVDAGCRPVRACRRIADKFLDVIPSLFLAAFSQNISLELPDAYRRRYGRQLRMFVFA